MITTSLPMFVYMFISSNQEGAVSSDDSDKSDESDRSSESDEESEEISEYEKAIEQIGGETSVFLIR